MIQNEQIKQNPKRNHKMLLILCFSQNPVFPKTNEIFLFFLRNRWTDRAQNFFYKYLA